MAHEEGSARQHAGAIHIPAVCHNDANGRRCGRCRLSLRRRWRRMSCACVRRLCRQPPRFQRNAVNGRKADNFRAEIVIRRCANPLYATPDARQRPG